MRYTKVRAFSNTVMKAAPQPVILLYNSVLKKEREHIAPEMLRLTDELMKKEYSEYRIICLETVPKLRYHTS